MMSALGRKQVERSEYPKDEQETSLLRCNNCLVLFLGIMEVLLMQSGVLHAESPVPRYG